jgi:hypothetical protein
MSTKQSRKRFSLDLKYKVIKLIGSKTPLPEIVNQLKDNEIKIKKIYKFNSQRSEIIKRFESSISTSQIIVKVFLPQTERSVTSIWVNFCIKWFTDK